MTSTVRPPVSHDSSFKNHSEILSIRYVTVTCMHCLLLMLLKKKTASIPYLLTSCCSAQSLKQEKYSAKGEEKRVGIRAGMGNICSVVKYVPKLEITNLSTVFKDSNAKLADINNLGKQHMVSYSI